MSKIHTDSIEPIASIQVAFGLTEAEISELLKLICLHFKSRGHNFTGKNTHDFFVASLMSRVTRKFTTQIDEALLFVTIAFRDGYDLPNLAADGATAPDKAQAWIAAKMEERGLLPLPNSREANQ